MKFSKSKTFVGYFENSFEIASDIFHTFRNNYFSTFRLKYLHTHADENVYISMEFGGCRNYFNYIFGISHLSPCLRIFETFEMSLRVEMKFFHCSIFHCTENCDERVPKS